MGPPGGPELSWALYNGTLYQNFQPDIRESFFCDSMTPSQCADTNVAMADARWVSLWGDLNAGPFNTDCLAETWDGFDCSKHAQDVPPTCKNRCDADEWSSECSNKKCAELVQQYSCEQHYCFNCTWSGWCDKECGVCSA